MVRSVERVVGPLQNPWKPMHFDHVVVDGSNIATEARSTPSLKQLDEAVKALMAEYDIDTLSVIVDATFGHRIDPAERKEFDEAVANAELVTPPAGAIGRGDAFVLQAANRVGAAILSNDSFQEFHGEYPWLFDEGRLIGGKPVPGVGWVFLLRSPVRGPASRRSVKESQKKASGRTRSATADSGDAPRRGARKSGGRSRKAAKAQGSPSSQAKDASGATGGGGTQERRSRRRRKGRGGVATPVNDALPFLEFVGSHELGSQVDGTVEEYSSHGAYITVDGARCYLPLHAMGDPAPARARDAVAIGETYQFVVERIDPPTRGIDVRLLATGDAGIGEDAQDRVGSKSTRAATATARKVQAMLTVEEEQVATARKATRKTAKRPAKKAAKRTTKKTAKRPAKKAAKRTTKRTTRKAPARRR